MSTSAFSQPEKLIKRTNAGLDEAWEILTRTFVRANISVVIEENERTGSGAVMLRMLVPIPDEFEERVTNALNNTRNAFDQMLFAACATIGRPLHDGHYPWCDSPAGLDWKLRNKKTGKETIPSEFWDVIRGQQPYPRGNGYEGGLALERAVATYANRKHTVGLAVTATAGRIVIPGLSIGYGTSQVTVPMPIWDPVKNEMALVRWRGARPELPDNYDITLNVGFDSSAPLELRRTSVIDALRIFASHAQFCLDGFKARCAELGF